MMFRGQKRDSRNQHKLTLSCQMIRRKLIMIILLLLHHLPSRILAKIINLVNHDTLGKIQNSTQTLTTSVDKILTLRLGLINLTILNSRLFKEVLINLTTLNLRSLGVVQTILTFLLRVLIFQLKSSNLSTATNHLVILVLNLGHSHLRWQNKYSRTYLQKT